MPTHRGAQLSNSLETTFSASRMRAAWQNTIRPGLRKQVVPDIHDYLDTHRNISAYVEGLRERIISGKYRPGPMEVITLEKRDGICRRLLLPSAADALILQTLVEVFEPPILEHQPNTNAYYSRSHVGRGVEHLDESFPYPWWLLWPEFQKRIWEFTAARPFVVSTDLANYFDSIPLASLRNVIAAMGRFEESLLDFLFYMLEAFTWRPFYMPLSGVGLPQIDFDAPRLLAHAYLFAADRELAASTNGDFVRWMDDINFGVDSESHARKSLGRLETVLNSYGLRLNTGKTKILEPEQAASHFWVQENMRLNVVKNLLDAGILHHENGDSLDVYLRQRYELFRQRAQVGQAEKIVKRFLKLFGRLNDPTMEEDISGILDRSPGLRKSALHYCTVLGFSEQRLETIFRYLRSGKCVDDAALFYCVRTLIDWHVPSQSSAQNSITTLAFELHQHCESHAGGVAAGIWLLAKYGTVIDLENYLQTNQASWGRNEWLGRQAAGIIPRISMAARQPIYRILAANGLLEGLGVFASVQQIEALHVLDPQMHSYLFWRPERGHAYPLSKVLLCNGLLRGAMHDTEKQQLRTFLDQFVTDTVYRAMLGLPVLRQAVTQTTSSLTLETLDIQLVESVPPGESVA